MKRQRIVCVGTGNIGRAWALAFAVAGHEVVLCDEAPGAAQAALIKIEASLADLAAAVADSHSVPAETATAAGNLRSRLDAESVLRRLSIASLEDAVGTADYVQESVPEDVAIKRALFERLAVLTGPHTIFGSSTSGLPGSGFMGGLSISVRALVVHPTNPPHLIPLTELCMTPWTSEPTYQFVHELMRDVGQVPVRLNREITGYALNRLQAAVLAEAMHLVGEGYICVADLDRTMSHGLGPRWAFMGPFFTAHLNANGGIGEYLVKYGDLYRSIIRELRTDYDWSPQLIEHVAREVNAIVPAKSVPDTQRWRDRKLAALRRHLEADIGGLRTSGAST